MNLGIALGDSYQLEPALAEFSAAGRLSPNTAAPHYNLGCVLVDLHRYEEARPEPERACRLAPAYPAPFYLLGLAEMKLQQYQDASETFNKLLALQPRNADAWFLLGQSLQKLAKNDKAAEAWKRAVEIDPGQGEALYNLSRVLEKSDPATAKLYRDRLVALQQQQQLKTQVETLANFALASANRGDFSQAVSQLNEAIAECGDCTSKADLYKDLGLIECKSGSIQSDEQNLLVAKSLKPQDPDVLKALEIVGWIREQGKGPQSARP